MTDQDAMLKLARSAMPEHKWHASTDGAVMTKVPDVDDLVYFDPANNDSQAVAVLCWMLMARDACVLFDCVEVLIIDQATEQFPHYSTPASFRAAVTKAALRVVG